MTIGNVGENFKPLNWLAEGWAALRDKAHSALLYFQPPEAAEEESGDAAIQAQRWGLAATDVVEHGDRLEIRMELPGMDKADLTVEISGSQIVIAGEKHAESTRRSGNAVVTERAFGRFQRVLPLPVEVDAANADARYADGILAIDLPRHRDATTRRISVD
jgi:HSP20 family protein